MDPTEETELDRVRRMIRELEGIAVLTRTPDQNNLLAGYLAERGRLSQGMSTHPFRIPSIIQLTEAEIAKADQRLTRGAAATRLGEPNPGVRSPEGRVHTIAQISKLPCHTHQPGGSKRFRLRCRVCAAQAAWYCVRCSVAYFQQPPADQLTKKRQLYAVCGMETGRDCYAKHHIL